MERIALYKDLNLEAVNFETLVKDIIQKSLSGYFKVVYWNYEDYLVYIDGSPIYGIRKHRDGRQERLDAKNYKPDQTSGTLYFYHIPIPSLILFINEDKSPPNPYSFVGYGDEFLSCVKASYVDWERLYKQIKQNEVDGYLIVCNRNGFKALTMLQQGQFIGVYGIKAQDNKVKLKINKEEDYVAVYRTVPEFPILMKGLEKLERVSGSVKDIKQNKLNALIELYNQSTRVYEFIHKGEPTIKLIYQEGEIKNLDVVPQDIKNFRLNVYKMEIPEKVEPIEFFIEQETQEEEVFEAYVSRDVISSVKKVFIEEIGPIGAFLWSKIIKDQGWREDTITEKQLKKLVDILHKEIPDEKHANRFIERIRRYVS